MGYFEDYGYTEPSALDELIDSTTEQIKDIIISEAKEKVDAILKQAEKAQEYTDLAQKRITRLMEEVSSLKRENAKQKTELEKKILSIGELPFNIGDKVYFIRPKFIKDVYCPVSNGTGLVNANTEQFGEVLIDCPVCHGADFYDETTKDPITKASYNVCGVQQATVKEISYRIFKNDKGEIQTRAQISLEDYIYITFNAEEIFSETQREECEKRCEEINKQNKEEAERKVGILKN